MRNIFRKIVGSVILSRDGKVLLLKGNPANMGAYEGYWVIPGGGIEEGEIALQAVIRETLEETGIDLSGYQIDLVSDTRKGESEKTLKDTGERVLVKMDFSEYKTVITDKVAEEIKITLSHEHSEYSWVKIEELKDVKLSPPSFGLFKLLGYI